MKFLVQSLWILVLVANIKFGHGQDDPKLKEHYLDVGPGWSFTRVKDLGMSPLTYQGHHVFPTLKYLRNTEDSIVNKLELQFRYGKTQPKIYPDKTDSRVTSMRADIDYTQLRKAGTFFKDNYEWWFGGSWITFFAMRSHNNYSNNAYNYDFGTAFSLAGKVRRAFQLFGHLSAVNFQILVPVVTGVVRPRFASSRPKGIDPGESFNGKNFRQSMDIVTFNHYQRLNTKLYLRYFLDNGNYLQLTYAWDYYHFDKIEANELWAASHGVYFATGFKF